MSETARSGAKKLEGVFARGYGVVPKAVMLESSLSPEAKALYAYYCVMSGNNGGFQPSPREEIILRSMHMSHTRFIKHRRTLIDQGYIVFSQQRRKDGKQFFENTRFLIVKSPRSSAENELLEQAEPLTALAAIQEGIFSGGFGLVPRMPLFDEKLSVEAKAAYIFLCVYANASTCGERSANPSASLLQEKLMKKARVQHAMNELIENGYIKRERLHNGAFAGMAYILLFEKQELQNDTTENNAQEPRFDTAENDAQQLQNDTAEKDCFSPASSMFSQKETRSSLRREQVENDTAEPSATPLVFETAEDETPEAEMPEIATSFMNNKTINTTQINIRHIDQITDRRTDDFFAQRAFYDNCRREAALQIEADVLSEEYGRDTISSLVMLMADIYAAREGQIRMNGRSYDIRQVAAVFKELRPHHIEYVLSNIKNRSSDKIGNMLSYLTTCLYNAAVSCAMEDFHGSAGLFI